MKIYYCLIQNNPLVNGVPCYHILQCEEIDTDDRERFEALRQEFEKLYYTRPGVSTLLLHLPTTDVKSLMRHAEGSSSQPPGIPEGSDEPEHESWKELREDISRYYQNKIKETGKLPQQAE